MLTFISFWRAAAIVLSDLASSAYYVGGDAEKVIGKSAPWFVLAVMLFSYAVRALYIESSAMFVRGGVYRVVKSALGGTLAKLSVSALLFDYILTGPISAVSAGQYLAGLITDTLHHLGHPVHWTDVPDQPTSPPCLPPLVTDLLLVAEHQGHSRVEPARHPDHAHHHRDGGDADHLVPHHHLSRPERTFRRCLRRPLFRTPRNLWAGYWDTWAAKLPLVLLLVGFGHSVLAMSGEESLAQVNREIEHPKLKNLEKTGLVIFIYSLLFTSLVSFFAVMIIPDKMRPDYFANLISGLAMNVVGPYTLRLIFQAFVVVVGALILSGAVNTAIVGANGVLNRLVEDGVLTSWFKKPHKKFGTSYRVLNLIAGLQLLTIVASRGDVYLLASLYAFGVIWSFSFMSLAVLVLRYKLPEQREWKVPGNFKIRRRGNPDWRGADLDRALRNRAGQLLHQGAGDHRGRELQRRLLPGLHHHRTRQRQRALQGRIGAGAVPGGSRKRS